MVVQGIENHRYDLYLHKLEWSDIALVKQKLIILQQPGQDLVLCGKNILSWIPMV